jgi:hypothetical protein
MINNWKSLELWIDTVPALPKVLMLVGYSDRTDCDVLDITANKIICSHDSYQEAVNWLLEDEFERVKGRVLADDELCQKGYEQAVAETQPELDHGDFVTIAGLEIEA